MRSAPLRFLVQSSATGDGFSRHQVDGEPVCLLNRPDLARHVLKDRATNYTKDQTPDNAMLRPLLGAGLLTSDGAVWARQRRRWAPAFRRAAVLPSGALAVDAALGLVSRWHTMALAGRPVRVDRDLTALTLGVVVAAMLGAELGGVGYLRSRTYLDSMVRAAVVGDVPRDSLLGQMLATDQRGEGRPSEVELRDQVLTIIMAAHETTAQALTWALHLLDRHPAAEARLRHEVDRVLGGRPPVPADLPALVYCRAVIEESMRLYPPIWLISRRAAGPDIIDGQHVAPGTLVHISPYLLHRHPGHWAAPGSFRPERFTAPGAGWPSHLYLPFGAGPRICLGRHFAMVEAVLVLAVIIQSLRLRAVPGDDVEAEALVTLRPAGGLVMAVRSR